MVAARFLRRTDIPPLAQDAPIDAIAQWLARQIEIKGDLQHWLAVLGVTQKFGGGFTYVEVVTDGGAGDPHRPFWHRPAFGYPRRELFHPEILRALKRLTGKKIVWDKDCRWWRLVKGAKLPSMPLASSRADDPKHHGPVTPTSPNAAPK